MDNDKQINVLCWLFKMSDYIWYLFNVRSLPDHMMEEYTHCTTLFNLDFIILEALGNKHTKQRIELRQNGRISGSCRPQI